MSILLVKIKFENNYGNKFFTQYFEVSEEQHDELTKLNIDRNKHTCYNDLIQSIKNDKIYYPHIEQNKSCSFCNAHLGKISLIESVFVNEYVLQTESNFMLDTLLQICKDEKELPLHKVKIDEMIQRKRIEEYEEIIRKDKAELEMRLEQQRITGLYTYEVECSKLRRGDYVMIDNHPCRLIEVTKQIYYRD